jgi:hypothetical protein
MDALYFDVCILQWHNSCRDSIWIHYHSINFINEYLFFYNVASMAVATTFHHE